jgi:hypothetical protein
VSLSVCQFPFSPEGGPELDIELPIEPFIELPIVLFIEELKEPPTLLFMEFPIGPAIELFMGPTIFIGLFMEEFSEGPIELPM